MRGEPLQMLIEREGRSITLDSARIALLELRNAIAAGALDEAQMRNAVDDLPAAVERQIQQSLECSLRPVINATGVILHTNLGRAPLSQEALEHVFEVSKGYSNLESDLATGERGKRDIHVDRLFAKLLGNNEQDVSTIVVNNNAAAVLLALNALAEGGEVLVSSTVRDLVAGSGLEFAERGSAELKGVPGEWRLYAIVP